MAGIDIVHVGYKGTGAAVIALVSGETHMMFATLGSVDPHVRSGRLRALAVTSRAATALAPDLPTISASGLPGYEATAMIVLLAPAATPAGIVARLNQAIVSVLELPEVRARLLAAGTEVVGSSPAELMQTMKSEMSKWENVIRQSGIKR